MHNISCLDQLADYLIYRSHIHERNLRKTLLHLPKVKTNTGRTIFQYSAAEDSFTKYIRDINFLKRLKTELYGCFRDLDVKFHCSLLI